MLWLAILAVVYLIGLFLAAYLSVHPVRIPIFVSPGAFGASQEDVKIASTPGITLSAWWIEAENAKTVLIFCHGYVMNRAELAPVAYRFWQMGVSSLLIDFRAHGNSKGGHTTLGWNERHDVKAAVAYARKRCPGAKIALVGSSMGSAASAFAVAEDPDLVDAVVLDSSYSKLSSVIGGWWNLLGGKPLKFILAPTVLVAGPLVGVNPFKIDVAEALRKSHKVPFLVMHGRRDTLSKPSEAERNLAALPPETQVVWFETSGHSEGRWLEPELYFANLLTFFKKTGVLNTEPQVQTASTPPDLVEI